MKRIFAVLAIVVLSLGLMGMGASAEESNETNATVESDDLGGDLAAADTLEQNKTVRFSDAHRIVGWEFDEDRVQVAVAMNISGTVEISDALAGAGEKGAIQVPKTSYDLERGIHVLTFPIETVQGGSAVGVTIDGDTVRLSTALEEQQEANPFETFGGESGLFTGVLMTVILAAAAAWWVIRSENSGVIEA